MTEDYCCPETNHRNPFHNAFSHVHVFSTMSYVAREHQHMIIGTTSPAIPTGSSHTHSIRVRTSSDPKEKMTHWHYVDIMTGPALETPDGEHTHYLCGDTSFDADHCHRFASVTDLAPPDKPYYEE